MIGSFLNVAILRLPVMLHRQWRTQCESLLELQNTDPTLLGTRDPSLFNLASPASRCPNCHHKIRCWENIPVLSYLFLKGACRQCQSPISLRYPLIECLTALISTVTLWHFGFNWTGYFALILSWILIVQSMIDYDHQILLDSLTLPLLWLGLLLSLSTHHTISPHDAIIGAVVGYLSLWSIYWLFKLITGKEGMGHGDFKLLAMLGAWLGWFALPAIILISSITGAVLGLILIALKRHKKEQPLPFGPFIAIAGWIVLLWGDKINQLYYGWIGFN